MLEVYPNLFVGNEIDEQRLRGDPNWFFIHACKEPYHRQALGYTGKAAPKNHPEYLIARRNSCLILNLIDGTDVNYVSVEIIDVALETIHANIGKTNILLHCNQGLSRSPSIALLYLARYTDLFVGLDVDKGVAEFQKIYPSYAPARGMADYIRLNWSQYQFSG
ncbi:dual specificity protein phosphatase family protein [Novacetimonas hansenii]|jgi:hypothetical protein|uniref:Tyrosine specific protein phosphatases domain-containing protein n=2 Tax=Novacetimonas hansenii TaxID=436 RepID=A0ABQ0SF63_NOVHA|nr:MULTISPECIES: dual specificity protein phosphatase family protein [Acetobacteraceae]EFG84845.1 dual specificity protein phosphatase [Novacetimonas hansenii ATCC 23769]MBS1016567.1 dual specificity protein phosphatase family protein [Acetobacter persici]MCG0996324.1 dual specificity protein phosphatase family protein [Acetobacter indonesiensis]MCH4089616.1 dual specificity protein phosphatase family protein [Acetobacter sp.]MCI1300596.1 dual specificity protein phosphatase family protein [Ac